jgi:hypothetical protein
MKRVFLCIWLLLLVGEAMTQEAQKESTPKNQNSPVIKRTKQKQQIKNDTSSTGSIITLSSSSNNKAFASTPSFNRFPIADSTLKALNAKANGANIKFNGSPLIGVPKGTYGFANGRLTLYTMGATSTGTITGSGSVGTGTSPGAISTLGPVIGVNGKSPYTGQGPYGTRVPVLTKLPDSSAGFGMRRRF